MSLNKYNTNAFRFNALIICLFLIANATTAQELASNTGARINGRVVDMNNKAVPYAHIFIQSIRKGAVSDANGNFELTHIPFGAYRIDASSLGLKSDGDTLKVNRPVINDVTIQLDVVARLSEVEVFGNRYEHPDKIEAPTRLPLKPYEQIQSISAIISTTR